METHFAALDWIVLAAYILGTISIGFSCYDQRIRHLCRSIRFRKAIELTR
jgi:hypothetical protein